MDDIQQRIARWRATANAILRAKTRTSLDAWNPGAPSGDVLVVGPSMAGLLRRLGPQDFLSWSEGMQRELASYYLGQGPDPRSMAQMRAVRLGFAVSTRKWGMLRPTEVALLEGLGFARPDDGDVAPSPPATPPAGDAFHVDYAFVYAGTKPGTSRTSAAALGVGTTVVERVDADAARPIWRLPTREGNDLVVVKYDGGLFRPVLRPGSWEPASETDFVAACAGEDQWGDDPFAPRAPATPIAPRERAWPAPDKRPSDAENRAAVEGASRARAGRLLSIGGIVHRATRDPEVAFSAVGSRYARSGDHDCVVVGWKVDGLSYADDMSALRDEGAGRLRACRLRDGVAWGTLPASLGWVAEEIARALKEDWNPRSDLTAVLGELPRALASVPSSDPKAVLSAKITEAKEKRILETQSGLLSKLAEGYLDALERITHGTCAAPVEEDHSGDEAILAAFAPQATNRA